MAWEASAELFPREAPNAEPPREGLSKVLPPSREAAVPEPSAEPPPPSPLLAAIPEDRPDEP